MVSLPGRWLGRLAALFFGKIVPASLGFLAILHEIGAGRDHCVAANPMTFIDRAGAGRRARFLLGREDRLVRPRDAVACAQRFPDGECYVVPGVAHGATINLGPSFVDHVRTFVGTQLGDWKW